MIIFLSEPFLNLDPAVLVTHNSCSFHFFCLNSPTHLSSAGRDPALPCIPSSDMLPSLKAPPALTCSGSLFCLGYQAPFPITAGVPTPLCDSDLYNFVSNSLARMLAEFLKGRDHGLYHKAAQMYYQHPVSSCTLIIPHIHLIFQTRLQFLMDRG